MGNRNLLAVIVISLILGVSASGCVERWLTINTEPQGALVTLNDEEIGVSPVTVSFEWYDTSQTARAVVRCVSV
jgi:hypothetical protein